METKKAAMTAMNTRLNVVKEYLEAEFDRMSEELKSTSRASIWCVALENENTKLKESQKDMETKNQLMGSSVKKMKSIKEDYDAELTRLAGRLSGTTSRFHLMYSLGEWEQNVKGKWEGFGRDEPIDGCKRQDDQGGFGRRTDPDDGEIERYHVGFS